MNRVLIVDDVPDNIDLLRLLLETCGYEVDEARHGSDALAHARHAPPQVIISDLLMPVMDGYALLREWKSDARLKAIPFIVYTATYIEPRDVRLALDLGADAFIRKPAELQSFVSLIEELLAKARRGEMSPTQSPQSDDSRLLTTYSETMFRKLEHKVVQLEQANRMLAESQRIAHIGSWLWVRAGSFTCSEETYRICGVSPSSVGWGEEDFFARLHPEDRPALQRWLEACWAGAQPAELEARVLWDDGPVRSIRACGELTPESAGRPSHLAGTIQDITEHKRAGAALRESEANLAAAQELAKLGSWELAADAQAVTWSAQMYRFFARDPSLGPPTNAEMLELMHPDDRATARLTNERLMREGGSASIVTRSNPERGPMKWLEGIIVARRGDTKGTLRLLGTLQDVTERRQAQEAIREKTGQLEKALNMAGMGVWSWNLVTDQMVSLEGAGPITGLSPKDFPASGHALLGLLHPDDRATTREKVEHARAGEDYRAEFRLVLADGEIRWVAARGRCLYDAAGLPIVLAGLDQDITERKTLEERLRHTQRLEAIGQLAGGVAHDFNNILAAIYGNAERARRGLSEGHPALMSILEILRAGERGKELVQRILAFSRPQDYQLSSSQLEPVLREAERLLRATLPAGVDLQFDCAPGLRAVRADPSQIHQIVLNLITNAWHAMENHLGRIEVRLEASQVDNSLCQLHPQLHPGPHVRLVVSDTGKGMDAATLEHIFEPFFTTKPTGQGTGLGLSVVHGIVRDHGGAIFADSEVGLGSRFYVYLPAIADAHGETVAEPQPARSVRGRGEHILYVDDEEQLVLLAVEVLEHVGYHVHGFTSVSEALSAFSESPQSYDVVITDYNMPAMSGVELARRLMRIRPGAPIALTSGYLRPAELVAARESGIREIIAKPYRLEDLDTVLQRMLSA